MTDNNKFMSSSRHSDPIRVFLDSKNAYQINTGTYHFYPQIQAYFDHYDIYIQVKKIQCTYSWYNITSSNNILSFNSGSTIFTIEPGNYSIFELIDILNVNSDGYTFSVNSNTGRVTVSKSVEFSWDVTSSMYNVLGWTTFPTGSATSFTSTSIPDVSIVKAVNFHLTTIPAKSFAEYPSSSLSRLIGTMFVGNVAPYTVIETSDVTYFRESSLQNRIRMMEIVVVDQRGEPIDLQSGSFQILMEFTFEPKKVFRLTDFM